MLQDNNRHVALSNVKGFINPIPKVQKSLTEHLTLPLVNRLKSQDKSINTIRGYEKTMERLLRHCHYKSPDLIKIDEVISFLVYLNEERKVNWRTMKTHVAAIRFYWREILEDTDFAGRVPYPKEKPSLPKILSRIELQSIFDGCANLKHRVLIRLIYSSGLRRCEVLNLKLSDIETQDGKCRIRINNSKGGKDRYTVLSPTVLVELREYFKIYRPKVFLFNGYQSGKPLSPGALRHALKNAVKKSGVIKPVNLHILRHCFATHAIEHGMHVKMLQQLMGHSSLETTLIYLQVSEVDLYKPFSPLDKW